MRGNWFIISAVGAVGLATLTSCTVGPDYHKPNTTMPTQWAPPTTSPTTLPSTTSTRPADLISWWKTFNDPELDKLVVQAIDSNLSVKQAEARIRQARAQLGISQSAYWPSVNATADATRSRVPGPKNDPGNGFQQNSYRAGFDAAWELDVFGQTRRSVEASNADLAAAVEDRRDVLVTLLGDVATTYIDLRGQQERIIIAKRNLDLQQRTADVTRRQFTGGFVSGLDVANADAQVATTKAQIPVLEAQVRNDIYALGVLLGRDPADLVDELNPQSVIPTTPPDVPVGLPSELLRRRPDIRRAEQQIHAATARIGVATADLYPKFSLTGNFGLSSSTLSGLSNISNNTWSVGPSMSWNIFNAGATQSNIEVQKALQEQSFLTYKQTILTALKDVDSSLVNYAKEQEHRQALADAVAANRKAVDLASRLYQNGQTDFLNVLSAQRALLVVEDAYSQSTATIATDLVSLYKALGGGWENHAYPATQPAPAK